MNVNDIQWILMNLYPQKATCLQSRCFFVPRTCDWKHQSAAVLWSSPQSWSGSRLPSQHMEVGQIFNLGPGGLYMAIYGYIISEATVTCACPTSMLGKKNEATSQTVPGQNFFHWGACKLLIGCDWYITHQKLGLLIEGRPVAVPRQKPHQNNSQASRMGTNALCSSSSGLESPGFSGHVLSKSINITIYNILHVLHEVPIGGSTKAI